MLQLIFLYDNKIYVIIIYPLLFYLHTLTGIAAVLAVIVLHSIVRSSRLLSNVVVYVYIDIIEASLGVLAQPNPTNTLHTIYTFLTPQQLYR